MTEDERKAEHYRLILQQARSIDTSALESTGLLSIQGYDTQNRRIVMLMGNRFPTEFDPRVGAAFLFKALDTIVAQPYVIVYFHTDTTSEQRPDSGFLRRIYNTVDLRYCRFITLRREPLQSINEGHVR
eukprot:m.165965 g.165965  ORF g.165965 m.165965 type:complete len:129 (+) comp14438_c1_seq5:234-620(+)